MPNIGELVGNFVELIGSQVGASSLRLGPVPTITIFIIVLVLLSLIARPATRWTTRDLGRLAAVPRAMALAAESGSAAVFSLGSAGVSRATSAFDRLQTLGALAILGHVARSAASAGVPLRVTANDPVAVHLAESVLANAHRSTATPERAERSDARYLGEGRPLAAAAALAVPGGPGAAIVAGALAEESLLVVEGTLTGAAWTSAGTASASQAASVLLEAGGTLIGPELYEAPSDLHAGGHERTGVLASNRLILTVVAVLIAGSAIALVTGVDPAASLAGR
jgi:hypothetical protein